MRILPSLSKIHERLSYNQMHTDFSIFSLSINVAFLMDIASNSASEQLLKKWKKPEITIKYVLTDLSKAFDCLYTISLLSDCNWTRSHSHLVHKRTLNHLDKPV